MKKLALGAICLGFMVAACGDDGGDNSDDLDDDVTDVTQVDSPVTQGICDPLTQTPCSETERCTWIVENRDDPSTPAIEADVGRLGCAPAGSIAVGEECVITGPAFPAAEPPTVGMGTGIADNCVKGSWCRQFLDGRGLCKSICDVAGAAGTGPQCGDNFNCSRISATFLSMGAVIAGICEPTCNPLTQRTDTTMDEACGAPDPANPYLGCFAGDRGDGETGFACSRVPREAKGRTDRMLAHGPTDTTGMQAGVYSNGCEAGFVPAYRADTTQTIAWCNGICAPADSDNLPENAPKSVGDPTKLAKLPTKAAAAVGDGLCVVNKKGSVGGSDCRYAWSAYYYDSTTMTVADSEYQDTVGICFPYSSITYDHDADVATAPIGFPSCKDLPPAGATPDPTHGITADQLDCYSWARTQTLPDPEMRAARRAKFASVMQYKTTAPGQVAYRHILK